MTQAHININGLLIEMRKHAGLTQAELAEKSGISRKTISKWERDKDKDDLLLSQLFAVAEACQIEVDLRLIRDSELL